MGIGLQQTMYSISEVAEYQAVCAEVLSGSVAGREIEISYATTGGKNANMSPRFIQLEVEGLIL